MLSLVLAIVLWATGLVSGVYEIVVYRAKRPPLGGRRIVRRLAVSALCLVLGAMIFLGEHQYANAPKTFLALWYSGALLLALPMIGLALWDVYDNLVIAAAREKVLAERAAALLKDHSEEKRP